MGRYTKDIAVIRGRKTGDKDLDFDDFPGFQVNVFQRVTGKVKVDLFPAHIQVT
ncbi:hypothetical protein [Parabacteroides sp. AM08-6]|uniref:hypothetical protein n=1 Tax=Parabacteroides sp. AM08-6 TaxID=2292053 RepID=UPI001314B920|nr:hypothetical protein [Parabacteroides sp. AM08-6]